MKNIVFIGMPASGKSTVGVVVAKRLGYKFVDTDLVIQEVEKRLLKEIIAEEGNEGFLRIEDRVNAEIQEERYLAGRKCCILRECNEALQRDRNDRIFTYVV